MIKRSAQASMVLVFEGYEAEWLQHSVVHLARGAENFSHSMYRTGLRLKRDFDEVALSQ